MTKSPSPGETLRRGQAKVPQCKILQWLTLSSFQEFFNNLHKFSLLDYLRLSNSMKRIWYFKECFYDLLGCAFAVTLLEYNCYSKGKCVKMAGMWIIHNTMYYMYYWEKSLQGKKLVIAWTGTLQALYEYWLIQPYPNLQYQFIGTYRSVYD